MKLALELTFERCLFLQVYGNWHPKSADLSIHSAYLSFNARVYSKRPHTQKEGVNYLGVNSRICIKRTVCMSTRVSILYKWALFDCQLYVFIQTSTILVSILYKPALFVCQLYVMYTNKHCLHVNSSEIIGLVCTRAL